MASTCFLEKRDGREGGEQLLFISSAGFPYMFQTQVPTLGP